MKPKKCDLKYLPIHVIYAVSAILLVVLAIVLFFVPASEKVSTMAHYSDIVILPQPIYSSWLTRLTIETDGPCTGALYQLPCNQVQVNFTENYSNSGNENFIYCLMNSSFVFTHTSSHAADGFVFDDYDQAQSYNGYNCSDAPDGVDCVHFDYEVNLPTVQNVTIELPPYVGKYYFVQKSYPTIKFRVNRYSVQYSDRYKHKYFKGTLSKKESISLSISPEFHPWRFTNRLDCLLLNVTHQDCSGSSTHYQYVSVSPKRRYDILLWPGIVLLIVTVLEVYLLFGQCLDFKIRRKNWQDSSMSGII